MDIRSLKSLYLVPKFNDVKLASATGFVVENNGKRYLITNRHVVTGRHNITNECLDSNAAIPNKLMITIPIIKGNGASWMVETLELYNEHEEPIWIEHPIHKSKIDVVAIPLKEFAYNDVQYYLTNDRELQVTDCLYIVGYPYGYRVLPGDKRVAIWTMGTIASEPDLGLFIDGEQLPAFLIDSKTRSGQSGSPVIYYNNNGFVRENGGFSMYGGTVSFEVGIYSGRINKDSDLGYVWKWSVISEIIKSDERQYL